jgi:hypothetical protein
LTRGALGGGLTALAMLGTAAATVAADRLATPGGAEHPPDLRQVPPYRVRVLVAGRAPRERLVFASAVENVGQGPLVLTGRRAAGERLMRVDQLVDLGDESGKVTAQRVVPGVGRLRYVREATHAHWHFVRFERYELRRASDGRLVAPDRKTGFCVGNRYRFEQARAAAVVRAQDFDENCGPRRPALRRLVEGLSPGFGDDYPPAVEGQFIDVTRVPAGRYVLVHRTNLGRRLRDGSPRNDVASAALVLSRRPGLRPSVRVTARCPASARCP